MEDSRIVELYWERSETAIEETARRYGKYCYSIAFNILSSPQDAEESVNDTYIGAWNSIPPHRPAILSTFLGKLTRRISIKKWEERTAEKRGGSEMTLALEELSDCIPDACRVEQEVEQKLLTGTINAFVRALPQVEQKVFVCRYWYMDSIASICKQFGFSQSKVKSMLLRTRKKLQTHLEKEGVFNEI